VTGITDIPEFLVIYGPRKQYSALNSSVEGVTMSRDLNTLFDEILRLIEKQLEVLNRQTFVSGQEMEEYRERLEEIIALVKQLPPDSADR
jgi:hypothetical protein